MNTVEAVTTLNLTKTTDGTIRIGKSRVALESVFHHFSRGATAEEIAQKYPSLELASIYGAIAYILQNRAEVKRYIRKQEKDAMKIAAVVKKRFASQNAELRERILSRRNGKKDI